MNKITKENVYRLSEDALYIKLDQADLANNQAVQALINDELDRRLIIKARLFERTQREEQHRTEEFLRCQAQIKAVLNGSDLGRMKLLQLTVGVQFQEDYELDDISFVVTSAVAYDHQENMWTFESLEEAERKLTQLIYDRIYHYYYRYATPEKVTELTAILTEAA